MIKIDMHTHSKNSHDSKCPVLEMANAEIQRGVGVMAVTDHIDVEFCETQDLVSIAKASHRETDEAKTIAGDKIKILKGLEMGEAFWYPQQAKKIIDSCNCDVIIGSVHTVRYKDMTAPFSTIDFSKTPEDEIYAFLNQYFMDYVYMVQNTDFDIAAHLTNPIYYINAKHKRSIDLHRFDEQMEYALRCIINRGVSLEVNSHYASSLGAYMPDQAVIKMYYDLGGRLISTGSDAHTSLDAAIDFERLYETLKSIGFKSVCSFENRVAVEYSINN